VEQDRHSMAGRRRSFPSLVTWVVCLLVAGLWLTGDGLEAQSTDRASRVHLNYAVYHLQEALRSAEQSYTTYPLPGFDYHKLFDELHTVASGVDVFLRPRPGEPGPTVPAQIDGRYLAEHLLREERALEETTDHTRRTETTPKTLPRAEEHDADE
jgi:hypothetical protein